MERCRYEWSIILENRNRLPNQALFTGQCCSETDWHGQCFTCISHEWNAVGNTDCWERHFGFATANTFVKITPSCREKGEAFGNLGDCFCPDHYLSVADFLAVISSQNKSLPAT